MHPSSVRVDGLCGRRTLSETASIMHLEDFSSGPHPNFLLLTSEESQPTALHGLLAVLQPLQHVIRVGLRYHVSSSGFPRRSTAPSVLVLL